MKKNLIGGWVILVKTVNHSNMNFIDKDAFHIEESQIYTQIGKGIKSVEFIRSMGNKLLFIEAKSSFPNPNNTTPNIEKGNKTGIELFREEIDDICEKFIHSLNLYSAIDVGVVKEGFPPEYRPSDKVYLVFILVINSFKKDWCGRVERELINKLRESICILKIWKPEVHVINHETAIQRNLTII